MEGEDQVRIQDSSLFKSSRSQEDGGSWNESIVERRLVGKGSGCFGGSRRSSEGHRTVSDVVSPWQESFQVVEGPVAWASMRLWRTGGSQERGGPKRPGAHAQTQLRAGTVVSPLRCTPWAWYTGSPAETGDPSVCTQGANLLVARTGRFRPWVSSINVAIGCEPTSPASQTR